MADYFATAHPGDAAWAVHFLAGGRPKRLIPVRKLATWAMELSNIPPWLFEESYQAVGDLAETISLLLPVNGRSSDEPLRFWVESQLLGMTGQPEDAQRRTIIDAWSALDGTERFIWNKLITGGFRVGVSRSLVNRAIAKASGLDEATTAHRLMGTWLPSEASYLQLVSPVTADADISRPYPFFLAYALEDAPENLGSATDWLVEWKWDGIRAQVIRRGSQTFIWSRGEELVTDRFPEVATAAAFLPDGTVLDGELLGWTGDRPLPFAEMQRRIGRKKVGPKILREVPVSLIAYDLLEFGGEDVRSQPLDWRRMELERLVGGRSHSSILLSPTVPVTDWADVHRARDAARDEGAEGMMLKALDAPYGVGRRRGPWWKWKVDPFSVDAVLLYAQPGHGRRASLYTDYTFGVRAGDEIVPFAKAYSGLTDEEIRKLDRWIRRHTIEKFGPVRAVEPVQLFEIAFEGIRLSTRHKSGLAVRFPRIARWRVDKPAAEADSIETLRRMAEASG